jgi:ribosomal protein S12 methylthiotransferase
MWSGCFSYSREENTPAYNLKKKVSSKVAEKRVESLQEKQQKITENYLKDYVGKEISVIIEEVTQNNPEFSEDISEGLAIGRAWFQAPDVDGCVVVRYDFDDVIQADTVKPGNVLRAKVLASSGVDLDARLIKVERSLENIK